MRKFFEFLNANFLIRLLSVIKPPHLKNSVSNRPDLHLLAIYKTLVLLYVSTNLTNDIRTADLFILRQ